MQEDEPALISHIIRRNEVFYGKMLELRKVATDWLSYIPQSFPHYTRHTIPHSDEIISQISKLLFKEDDNGQCIVHLSPVEAYILVASAYLHDVGMVVSDSEKARILDSPDWQAWTNGEGGGKKRWEGLQRFRSGTHPADEDVRNFLADREVRFLIAEFVRRSHHRRAVDILTQHQSAFARFAFDDPILLHTIADVCFAHGLRPYELQDPERYPQRRDILGESANVRFLAILLRLGDLLDMSSDRACPLLLNAACPLPADSLAHWTEHKRITHRLTAPDRIELIAECDTQEEHRFLRDWVQWLLEEVQNAGILMSRAERHSGWSPPTATLEGPVPTISIRPSRHARYIPSDWVFELDREAVFQRFIYSVHEGRETFIRELLQNAFDANRCQMFDDLIREGIKPPQYPTDVDESRRRRYPVNVGLYTVRKLNRLSGEEETRQVVSVDDSGTGMDKHLIHHYLLQVGRSYYTSEEFARTYGFSPASRFGVGFLSVFSVSNHVTLETYRPASRDKDGPIRLTLTGPKSYLLMERGDRRSTGTRVDVVLSEQMAPGELTRLVSAWCRRVEFPIVVTEGTEETAITAERSSDFTYEIPDVTKENAKFAVRAFPTHRPGIEGELYVFTYTDERGESWADWFYAHYRYPEKHPQASPPTFPANLLCTHGISMTSESSWTEPPGMRVDYRKELPQLPMSRISAAARNPLTIGANPDLDSRWEEIVEEHLATSARALSTEGWMYKQRLVKEFPLKSFWFTATGTIRILRKSGPELLSLQEVNSIPILSVLDPRYGKRTRWMVTNEADEVLHAAPADVVNPAMGPSDVSRLSDDHRRTIFLHRKPASVHWIKDGGLRIDWELSTKPIVAIAEAQIRAPIFETILPASEVIAIECFHKTAGSVYPVILANRDHAFVKWMVRVGGACQEGRHTLTTQQFRTLVDLFDDAVRYPRLERLGDYLEGWKQLPLPDDLRPPVITLNKDMFRLEESKP